MSFSRVPTRSTLRRLLEPPPALYSAPAGAKPLKQMSTPTLPSAGSLKHAKTLVARPQRASLSLRPRESVGWTARSADSIPLNKYVFFLFLSKHSY